jgi:hypothetical protein
MKSYRIINKARFLVSVSLMMIIAVSAIFTMAVSAKDNTSVTMVPEYVEEGDTLWGMARNHSGDMDIREYISHVMDINEMNGSNIIPGELIYFPVYE